METANAEKKGINKNLIIIIAAVVVAIIALVVGGIFIFGEKTYRVLKIYQVEGQASVVHSDGSEVTPYENMLLQSGDKISLVEGTLIIKADEDKYIYLENNTTIILEADGTAADSRTSIQLLEGAVINQIEEPLSSKSVYELNTQNATMSVRGTITRNEYLVAEDGTQFTIFQTIEGVQEAGLRQNGGMLSGGGGADQHGAVYSEDGVDQDGLQSDDGDGGRGPQSVSNQVAADLSDGFEVVDMGGVPGNTQVVDAGNQTTAFTNKTTTAFVSNPVELDMSLFTKQTFKYLDFISKNTNKKMSVSNDRITEGLQGDEETPETCTVRFMNGTTVFGTVVVPYEGTVEEPMLMPTAKGHWKLESQDNKLVFPATITKDTDIVWVDESNPSN